MVVANSKGEVGKVGRAREGITTLRVVIFSTLDLGVVGGDNGVVHEEKSGTGVSNGIDAGGHELTIANLVASTSDFPETLGAIDRGVGDVSGILAAINETEVVGTRSSLLQVSREYILAEDAFVDGGVEESSLLLRLD